MLDGTTVVPVSDGWPGAPVVVHALHSVMSSDDVVGSRLLGYGKHGNRIFNLRIHYGDDDCA